MHKLTCKNQKFNQWVTGGRRCMMWMHPHSENGIHECLLSPLYFSYFYSMHSLCYYPCDTNKPTQSRASISMFAFFDSVRQGFVRFTLHFDSNVHVHIQFRKLIDLHVLSSVKLYKHPFLVWMLFSLHAWEIQSGTAVKEHYATATAHFASFSPPWNLCFCVAIACFNKQLFWYFHAIFGCKPKWELSNIHLFHGVIIWVIEQWTCCALFQSKGNQLNSNDAEFSKNDFFEMILNLRTSSNIFRLVSGFFFYLKSRFYSDNNKITTFWNTKNLVFLWDSVAEVASPRYMLRVFCWSARNLFVRNF